ncbi:MAG: Gfo/Idh/MocA family oxidoreductase [Tannerella sp.]|jgi:predicted dehydrogenase|nr:Gfo/Idh/MocA family oxidoreductase [Tannerella sp.]
MEKKIRFGIIGTNFITDWVLEGGREDGRFEAAAVCSRSADTARSFAARHGIPHIFTSVEEMASSALVDAVYIASPNALHAQQSILCMQYGKHVLCEKAFASNVGEVRQMLEAARRYGVVLMEAMKPTLTPAFRAVREALSEIGAVRRYFSCYCQYSSRYDKLKEGVVLNTFKPELSNGATMDIGVYTIYPMVVLFGRPKTIHAAGMKLPGGVDGQAAVTFTYENGPVATVLYGKIADSTLPTEIQGEQGTIVLDRINIIGDVSLVRRGGATEHIRPETLRNEYYYEVAEFIDIICGGRKESAINSHNNSLITIEILDEIRRQLDVAFPADKTVT